MFIKETFLSYGVERAPRKSILKRWHDAPSHIKKEVQEVCTHVYAKDILKDCPTFSILSIIIIVCLIIISSGLLIYFTILQ